MSEINHLLWRAGIELEATSKHLTLQENHEFKDKFFPVLDLFFNKWQCRTIRSHLQRANKYSHEALLFDEKMGSNERYPKWLDDNLFRIEQLCLAYQNTDSSIEGFDYLKASYNFYFLVSDRLCRFALRNRLQY